MEDLFFCLFVCVSIPPSFSACLIFRFLKLLKKHMISFDLNWAGSQLSWQKTIQSRGKRNETWPEITPLAQVINNRKPILGGQKQRRLEVLKFERNNYHQTEWRLLIFFVKWEYMGITDSSKNADRNNLIAICWKWEIWYKEWNIERSQWFGLDIFCLKSLADIRKYRS